MTSMAHAAGPGAERRMRERAVDELAAFRAGGGLLGLFERTGFRPISDVLAEYGILGQRSLETAQAQTTATEADADAPAVPQTALSGANLAMHGAEVVGPDGGQQTEVLDPSVAGRVLAEVPGSEPGVHIVTD